MLDPCPRAPKESERHAHRFLTIRYVVAIAMWVLGNLLFISEVNAESPSETPPRVVKVGIYVSSPFVIAARERYEGMAIELWEAVSAKLNFRTDYVAYPTFQKLIDATQSGQVDAAVTNLTITRSRAELIAFTQPWYDGGLRIMVKADGSGGFTALLSGLLDAGHIHVYACLFAIILAATIAITLFDRKFDPDFPRRWREGTAESFFHVISIATVGRTTRKNLFGWLGRVWQAIWLLVGVGVIAYITSSITSVMTAVTLEREIHSFEDLQGRTVGVFTGSVAENFVNDLGISSRSYPNLTAAVEAANEGEVDAIIGDAPVLEHFAYTAPEENMIVVGKIFHPDKTGFAFPLNSDLTNPATLQILELIEDGTVERLRKRFFGNST